MVCNKENPKRPENTKKMPLFSVSTNLWFRPNPVEALWQRSLRRFWKTPFFACKFGKTGTRSFFQQIAEIGQKGVLFLPGRVHQTAHAGRGSRQLEPASDIIQVIGVVVAGQQHRESLLSKKIDRFRIRFAAPNSHDQVLWHMQP